MLKVEQSKTPVVFWFVLAGWTLLNLVQAYFTELFHDETYFWLYSHKLRLVYWDHAPGIGAVIRAGTELFDGELGVRFFIVLLNSATLYILWRIVQPVKVAVFFSVAFSMLLMHLGGFFAAPDAPASFALALTLLAMKRFIEKPVLLSGVLLGISVAMVCWCKYQAIVMVLLLALACIRLWRKPAFWVAVGLALVLYMPHLYWLLSSKLSTFSYHLVQRGGKAGLGSRYLGDTLGGAALLLGPLITPLLLWATLKNNVKNGFIPALRLAVAGYIAFLIFISLVSPSESNWIAPAALPLLVVALTYFAQKTSLHKWLYAVGALSIVLILTLRTYLAWNFLPSFKNTRNEFHGWKQWAMQVDSAAAGHPVVFINSYQHASKYWFYSGHEPAAMHTFTYRPSEFDLLGMEEKIQGKRVLLAAGWDHTKASDTIRSANGINLWVKFVDNFRSYPKARIEMMTTPPVMEAGAKYDVPIRLWQPAQNINGHEPFTLQSPSGKSFHVGYAFRNIRNRPEKVDTCAGNLEGLMVKDEWKSTVTITAPEKAGEYKLYFFLQPDHLMVTENSGGVKVEVRPAQRETRSPE